MCRDKIKYDETAQFLISAQYLCPSGLPDEVKTIILDLYNQYDELLEREKFFEKRALEYAKNLEWETESGLVKGDELIPKLLTLPYVGEITVLVWLSEIVTPLRFPSTKHIAAFCGCDPSLKVSAGKTTAHVRRKGNENLHHALLQVAGICINQRREPFGQWGHQIFKRHVKGGYKKACGAVARRLATALYYCHLRNEAFTYEQYTFYKTEVPEFEIKDIELSTRVKNMLMDNNITSTKQMCNLFMTGNLDKIKGFGNKATREVEAWIRVNDTTKIKKKGEMQNAEHNRTASTARPRPAVIAADNA
jgi:hypothetical protein